MNHPYFRRAVLQAYERMIAAEDAPLFFLNLEVEPSTIDVNIHPTKTEIKFENEREIWSIISIAVKEALGKFNVTPSINFDTTDSIDIPVVGQGDVHLEMPKVAFNPDYNPFHQNTQNQNCIVQSQSAPRNWQKLFEVRSEEIGGRSEEVGVRSEELGDGGNFQFSTTQEPSLLYKNRYLCMPMKSGLMMIDIMRAITRICYDNLLAQVVKSSGVSQKLLFPEVLELTLDDKCIFTEIEQELRGVGFEFAEFGKSMYRIESVPAMLTEGVDVLKILENILSEVKISGCSVSCQLHQIIANIISQSEASMRIKRNMTVEERNALVGQLFASSNPNNAPDGKKIINVLSDNMIDAMF